MDVELPASPILTRLFCESPWTLAAPLLLAAAVLAWWGARNERAKPILAGVLLLLAAAGTLVIASFVTSPGEHAAQAVRTLVDAAVGADMSGIRAAFADDASMHYGGPQAPGDDIEQLMRTAERLVTRNRIERNAITELDFSTLGADSGAVILGCRTDIAGTAAAIPTRWHFEVRRQPDGRWLVERISWLSLAGGPPQRGW